MENLKFFKNMYDKKITCLPVYFLSLDFWLKGFPGNYSFILKKYYTIKIWW